MHFSVFEMFQWFKCLKLSGVKMVSAKFMGRKNVESPQIADKIGQNIVEKVIIFRFLAISNGNLCISRHNPTKSGSSLAANFKTEPV